MSTQRASCAPTGQVTFDAYWQYLYPLAQHASGAASALHHDVRVAGRTFRLVFAHESLTAVILPALAHLGTVSLGEQPPDTTLYICDGKTAGAELPGVPFAPSDYHRYGWRASHEDDQLCVMHAPTTGMLFAYQRQQQIGILWTEDAAALSIYERAAPLQTLFHWALRDHGWYVTHAAAVGRAEGGVLLVGNSGAGKSTTALAALQGSDLAYLSDDKCLTCLSPEPTAFALFNSAKLKEDMLAHLPLFRPHIAGWDDDFKAGKSLAFLHPHFKDRMIRTFPIRALVIPRIANLDAPRLARAQAADAFRALGPSTVIWLPGAEAGSYHFLARLVRTLPCYQLDLARNPADNLPAIRAIIDAERR